MFHDGWRTKACPPELINFAIRQFRRFANGVCGIPGQHDLPHHRYEDIEKSAYWTLVQAGVIQDLKPGRAYTVNGPQTFDLYGFPWKQDVSRVTPSTIVPKVAVVHGYCWMSGHCFPGCPQEEHVSRWAEKLRGFTAAVFGDNHKAFRFLSPCHGMKNQLPNVLNGGAFTVRRLDEKDHKPFVGLLTSDGEWRAHYLDTLRDRYLQELVDGALPEDYADFLETLSALGTSSLDFHQELNEFIRAKKVPEPVRKIITASLTGNK